MVNVSYLQYTQLNLKAMSAQFAMSLLAWLLLAASWFVPNYLGKKEGYFENGKDAYLIGMVLAALATGIFLTNTVYLIFK